MEKMPEFENEALDIIAFIWSKSNLFEPDGAYVATGDEPPADKLRINIFPEDRKAIEKAGYVISRDPDEQEPIPVIINESGRKIDFLIGKNNEEIEIMRHREPIPMPGGPIGAPRTEPMNGTTALKAEPQLELVPPPPSKASLYAKIARVMGEIGTVEERGHHGQGYTYVTDGDMYNAVRAIMAKHNLAMLPPRLLGQRVEKDGTYIDIEFTLADGNTGATEVTPWFARLQNSSDKAIHAAMTMCVKYFLKYTFLISTKGDADADADTDVSPSRSSASKSPVSRKPAKPAKPAKSQAAPKDDAPRKFNKPTFDWDRVYTALGDLFEDTKTIDAAIDEMLTMQELHAGMIEDAVIKAVRAKHDPDEKRHARIRADLGSGTEQRRIPAKEEAQS